MGKKHFESMLQEAYAREAWAISHATLARCTSCHEQREKGLPDMWVGPLDQLIRYSRKLWYQRNDFADGLSRLLMSGKMPISQARLYGLTATDICKSLRPVQIPPTADDIAVLLAEQVDCKKRGRCN